MMKMLFALKEDKIKADGKSVEAMWEKIEKAFEDSEYFSEKQSDGCVAYSSSIDSNDDGNIFGVALAHLAMDEEFLKYCEKWTWTEFGEDGVTVVEEEDVFEQVKDGLFIK